MSQSQKFPVVLRLEPATQIQRAMEGEEVRALVRQGYQPVAWELASRGDGTEPFFMVLFTVTAAGLTPWWTYLALAFGLVGTALGVVGLGGMVP